MCGCLKMFHQSGLALDAFASTKFQSSHSVGLSGTAWGEAWRLWPSLLVVAITLVQMAVFNDAIRDFQSSLRASLVVGPNEFGETGFVQPTALFSVFFPLGSLGTWDDLTEGMVRFLSHYGRGGGMMNYKLDTLLFSVGAVPLLLTAVFFLAPAQRRLRLGLGLFILLLTAISLQQSSLYRILYYFPYFNVFRNYILLFPVVVFAVLVASGYGFDVLTDLEPEARRRVAARAVAVILAAMLAVAWALHGVLAWIPADPQTMARFIPAFAVDVAILAAGMLALWWCGRAVPGPATAAGLIGVLMLGQVVHTAGSYRAYGTDGAGLRTRLGVSDADMVPPKTVTDPNRLIRTPCEVFAQCYLAAGDTASLRTDLDGTFLRPASDAVFHKDLARPVVEALSAVGQPVFRASRRAEPFGDVTELTAHLNSRQASIGSALDEEVAIPAAVWPDRQLAGGAGTAHLANLSRGPNWFSLDYRADGLFFLSAAITWSAGWRAVVGAREVRPLPANFSGMAVAVAGGIGSVHFEYHDWRNDFFFISRALLTLFAFAVVYLVAVSSACGAERNRKPV